MRLATRHGARDGDGAFVGRDDAGRNRFAVFILAKVHAQQREAMPFPVRAFLNLGIRPFAAVTIATYFNRGVERSENSDECPRKPLDVSFPV